MPRGAKIPAVKLSTGSGNFRLKGSWLASRLPSLTDAGTWKASTPPLYLRASSPHVSHVTMTACREQSLAVEAGAHGVSVFWLTT